MIHSSERALARLCRDKTHQVNPVRGIEDEDRLEILRRNLRNFLFQATRHSLPCFPEARLLVACSPGYWALLPLPQGVREGPAPSAKTQASIWEKCHQALLFISFLSMDLKKSPAHQSAVWPQ